MFAGYPAHPYDQRRTAGEHPQHLEGGLRRRIDFRHVHQLVEQPVIDFAEFFLLILLLIVYLDDTQPGHRLLQLGQHVRAGDQGAPGRFLHLAAKGPEQHGHRRPATEKHERQMPIDAESHAEHEEGVHGLAQGLAQEHAQGPAHRDRVPHDPADEVARLLVRENADGHARQVGEDVFAQAVGADFDDLLPQVVLEVFGDASNDRCDTGEEHDQKHGLDRIIDAPLPGQEGGEPLHGVHARHARVPLRLFEPRPAESLNAGRIAGCLHLCRQGLNGVLLGPPQLHLHGVLLHCGQFLQQTCIGGIRLVGPELVDVGEEVSLTKAGLFGQAAFGDPRHLHVHAQRGSRLITLCHGGIERQPVIVFGRLAVHPAMQTFIPDHDLQERDDRHEA